MPLYRPILERFREKYVVNVETGCWDWTGSKVGMGYGVLGGERRAPSVVASRFSYEQFRGPIFTGKIVMHLCDNPGCVNPEHLKLGTHADNMSDMLHKGRARLLSAEQIVEAQELLQRESLRSVATRFNVDPKTLRRALAKASGGDLGGVGREVPGKRYVQLNDDQRQDVLRLLAEKWPVSTIAARFGVANKTIRNIRAGVTSADAAAARRSKLTPDVMSAIRALRDEGLSQEAIAARVGVEQTTVSRALSGKLLPKVARMPESAETG